MLPRSACRKSMCHLAICAKGVRLLGTPGEGSPPKNSPPDCFSPLLRSLWAKISQSADCAGGFAPRPHRLFEKRRTKTFGYFAIAKQFIDRLKRGSSYAPPIFLCHRLNLTALSSVYLSFFTPSLCKSQSSLYDGFSLAYKSVEP